MYLYGMRNARTQQTQQSQQLSDHVKTAKGIKTVCVSTCLNFLGISADTYKYTSTKTDRMAYKGVMRRKGLSVRSRKSELKVGGKNGYPTMTKVKSNLRKSAYGRNDLFMVIGYQKKCAHMMILNGEGNVVIDTAPGMKWKIEDVSIIEKSSNKLLHA